MKHISTSLIGSAFLALASCASQQEWVLDWQEDFNAQAIDETVWSRIDRGHPDWQNTQSKDDRCYELRDGKLILKGIVNDNPEADPAPYLTGGLWTKDKKAFEPGRFEISCRLHGAQGAWPAIWLLPYEHEKYPWPVGGEIDILERLNHDSIAYQTVHSHYTVDMGNVKQPQSSRISPIDPDAFNVYGVDITPDSIAFHINGLVTHVYPRLESEEDNNQYPFNIPQYLLIDMQLGGKWVGPVDPQQLPVEMEIDWVKYYKPGNRK